MTAQTLPWYCCDVSCKYGAPMGRTSYGVIADAAEQSLTVSKLPMDLVDRDYDMGGAYWGHIPGSYIYCCFDEADGDDGICRYERATSETMAIEKFGIKPEQLNPHPAIHPRPEPVLCLDIDHSTVCVSAIVAAFANEDDYDSLMMSAADFCMPGGDSRYSWIYAKEQVENWHFSDKLYLCLERYFVSSGAWGEGELSRLDLRGMLLQEVAGEYDQWLRYCDEDMSFGEWLSREDCSGTLCAEDDGGYYMHLDS